MLRGLRGDAHARGSRAEGRLARDAKGRSLGFLEHVPGEHAWRPVAAKGWLFVHCPWVFPKGQAIGGLGRRLVQAAIEEARR